MAAGDHGLEDCLTLLRGEKDEQRLTGLLLATKFCRGDDKDSILKVFHALGMKFLDRLLRTGTGKSTGMIPDKDQQEAYLQLALTIFAAFCRVPDLASLDDIISKVPIILETLTDKAGQRITVECFECLLGIATASEKGFFALRETRAIPIIANHIYLFPDDSPSIEMAVKLMQFLLAKMPMEIEITEYTDDLAAAVVAISRQFAIQQTSLKFDALLLISTLVASEYSVPIRNALQSSSRDPLWPTYVRIGIGTILQNRVVADKKHLALSLAKSMMEMFGEDWLIGPMNIPGDGNTVPLDRCFLLVLEISKVEIAVLLNELAHFKFDSSSDVSSNLEDVTIRQRDLANMYTLMENIIKLLSNACDKQGNCISESSMVKAMTALNESVGFIFDFLLDAKAHDLMKGDDLLASIRIIGRYLAESPSAYQKQFQELLPYIFSVTGESEERPFLSVQFSLPVLCQTTMDHKGCNALVSCGGHKQVLQYFSRLVEDISQETVGTILLTCDIIMNILLKRDEMQVKVRVVDFLPVLPVLAAWAAKGNDSMAIAMSSTISTLVLDMSSEDSLAQIPEFQTESLSKASELIIQCLELCQQAEKSEALADEQDLYDITVAGCARLIGRYPSIRRAIRTSSWFQHFLQNQSSMEAIMGVTSNPCMQNLLMSIIG